MVKGGWAELPDELVEKVLEELQAAGQSEPQGPFGLSQATATVRLVCSGWKAVKNALVKMLDLRLETTDEAMGMLARRFPAVVSLEFKRKSGGPDWGVLTDQGMLAVSSLPALTSLNLRCCRELTDESMRAVSSLPALTTLNLRWCDKVSDEGMRAVRSCASLTSLDLSHCDKVTNVGLRELRGLTALTMLNFNFCRNVTGVGLQELTSLTALNTLFLWGCSTSTMLFVGVGFLGELEEARGNSPRGRCSSYQSTLKLRAGRGELPNGFHGCGGALTPVRHRRVAVAAPVRRHGVPPPEVTEPCLGAASSPVCERAAGGAPRPRRCAAPAAAAAVHCSHRRWPHAQRCAHQL
jgi:hypothetical protein